MTDSPTQFSDLKLDPKVLQAVAEAGYTTPTPIQLGAIPPALEGRDVLGIAQTGTGKTAGFVLPMITLLGRGRARARMPRSLVLCPTRELAAQVAENFDTYAKHTRLTKALLIGGVSFGEQDKLIDRGVDVLIATPGRLLDHFERGKLLLTGVQIMVVDEADRMLDMGFIPDIERIFTLTPFTRQTLFFSATMAPEIERITDTFLHAPARIEVARQATASETITQRLVEITPTRKDQTAKQKRELMRALIDAEGEALKNAIIFCNRKTEVDVVAKSLKAHGYDAAPIHGDLDQSQRTRTLEGFREGTLRFLVASDVAARGLDIPAVSHVFNFDLPSHAEDYVHRIGRTGRAGREGTAISLAVPADEKYLTAIEGLLKKSLPRAPVPEGFSLSEAAQSAPRPREERGGRDNGRGRSRGGRDRDRREEAHRPAAEAQPREARVEPRREEPRREEPRREDRRSPARDARPDQRPEARPEARPDARGQDRGHDRPDSRRRDDRKDDRRAAVVGLGDHMPDFMTRSFRTSLMPMEGEFEETLPASRAEAIPATAAPAPADAPAAPSSSRSRERRGRKPARADLPAEPAMTPADEAERSVADNAVAAAEAAVVEAALAAGADLPAASADVPTADAPAPAEAPAPEVTAAAEAETPAQAPAPKAARAPRARRTKAAPAEKTAAPEAGAPVAETPGPAGASAAETPAETPAPKAPRATRTRRKAPAAEKTAAPEEKAAPDTDAEAPAPRRTRSRRKPAAEAGTDASAVPASEADAPVVRDEA